MGVLSLQSQISQQENITKRQNEDFIIKKYENIIQIEAGVMAFRVNKIFANSLKCVSRS